MIFSMNIAPKDVFPAILETFHYILPRGPRMLRRGPGKECSPDVGKQGVLTSSKEIRCTENNKQKDRKRIYTKLLLLFQCHSNHCGFLSNQKQPPYSNLFYFLLNRTCFLDIWHDTSCFSTSPVLSKPQCQVGQLPCPAHEIDHPECKEQETTQQLKHDNMLVAVSLQWTFQTWGSDSTIFLKKYFI